MDGSTTRWRSVLGQRVLDGALGATTSVHRRAGGVLLAATRRAFDGDHDPVVRRRIGTTELWLPLSHRLPDYLDRHRGYGTNLPRLVAHLEREQGRVRPLVDVGANIGDTVALVRDRSHAPVLCVEADDRFAALLDRNLPALGDVTLVRTFLGRRPQTVSGTLRAGQGTGRLVPGAHRIVVRTLDDVVAEHPRFADAGVVKVDVDGMDFEVLGGAHCLLASARPVLFVEYDPTLVEAQRGDARAGLEELRAQGYGPFVAYDNVGEMALSGSLDDSGLVDDLHDYVAAKRSATFWDLAIFPAEHGSSCCAFAAAERARRSAR